MTELTVNLPEFVPEFVPVMEYSLVSPSWSVAAMGLPTLVSSGEFSGRLRLAVAPSVNTGSLFAGVEMVPASDHGLSPSAFFALTWNLYSCPSSRSSTVFFTPVPASASVRVELVTFLP